MYGDWQAIITMQQLIVLATPEGVIDMTPQAISGRTSIPLEIIEAGLASLLSDDPLSRTEDMQGKRIVLLDAHRDWGYRLVNHEKYRNIVSIEQQREANRVRQQRHRERAERENQEEIPPENHQKDVKTTENQKKGASRMQTPTFEEVAEYEQEREVFGHAQKFYDFYTSNGWKVGRNPMKDWRAAFRNWVKNAGQFQGPGNPPREGQMARAARAIEESRAARLAARAKEEAAALENKK